MDSVDHENQQNKFFALLRWVHHTAYSPTRVEWMLIQDCLDDQVHRGADIAGAAAAVLTLCLRRHLGLRPWAAAVCGCFGWEFGYLRAPSDPVGAFFGATLRLDTPLGEQTRQLLQPQRLPQLRAPPHTGITLLETVPCFFRDVLAGSYFHSLYDFEVHLHARLVDWTVVRKRQNELPRFALPRRHSLVTHELREIQPLILNRTSKLAQVWWSAAFNFT